MRPGSVPSVSHRPPRKYYELTDSAEPMLQLARERFPSPAVDLADRATVDQTR